MTNYNKEFIELLTKLVSIPSPSLHEAKASTYLAGWMNAHGLRAYVDEAGNATMIWDVRNAFSVKIGSTDLKAEGNEVAIEALEIAHESFTIRNP